MKRTFAAALALVLAVLSAYGQDTDERKLTFSDEIRIPVTPVRSQGRSSTCWCFSGISFVEAEIIRINKIKNEADYPALSEAYVIGKSLHDRAIRYVRLKGNLRAAPGSEGADVVEVIRKYGIMPREAFPAPDFTVRTTLFREFVTSVRAYLQGVVERRDKPLNPEWLKGFDGIVAGYIGSAPDTFSDGGRTWTPEEYRDKWKFDATQYASVASVTDVSYGETFVLEIMDNWRWTPSLNVPLDDMITLIDKAVDKGYTVHIATDTSQKGHQHDGYATVVPEDAPYTLSLPDEEPKTTPGLRQELFDAAITTDDHAMHLIGRAFDQYGRKFYIIKDSHGDYGQFHGYVYMSEEYVRRNVLHILVHKDILKGYRVKR